MKTRKGWIVLAVAATLAAVVLMCGPLRSREPSYNGKPVSYWLDMAAQGFAQTAPMPGQRQPDSSNGVEQAREALAGMGPPALPYLVARMGAPVRKHWYDRLLAKLPSGFSVRLSAPRPKAGFSLITGGFFFNAITDRAGTNAVPILLSLSSSPNPAARRLVLLNLSRVPGADHRIILPVFGRALRDPDPAIRFDACRCLSQMAGTDPEARAVLANYLANAGTNLSPDLRLQAVAALAGEAARTNSTSPAPRLASLPASVAANLWERAFAALADWQQNPTPESKAGIFVAFQSAFDDPAANFNVSVERAFQSVFLNSQQEREVLVPILAKGLLATNAAARTASARLLSEMGPAVEPALPALIEALDGASLSMRVSAIRPLAGLGQKAAPAVPGLVRLLKEDSGQGMMIWELTQALEQIGPGARDAVPALLEKLKDNQGFDHAWLLSALVAIDPHNPDLVPALIRGLAPGRNSVLASPHEQAHSRYYPARLLGQLGPTASNALPALRKMMLEDPALEPRLEAMEAILKIDPAQGPSLVPVMIEALDWGESDSHRTPAIVARLLGEIGPQASPRVVPELVKLLDDKEVQARLAAALALAKVAPKDKPKCFDTLHQLLQVNYGLRFRLRTIEGLWSIAPDDPLIMPELTRVLLPNNELQGDEAFDLLLKMGSAAKPALPQVRALLQGHDWRVRRAARDLLEKLESINKS